MTDLIQRFITSIREVSYFEAAEGRQYLKEAVARNAAKDAYMSLRREMISQFGEQITSDTVKSIPNLLLDEAVD